MLSRLSIQLEGDDVSVAESPGRTVRRGACAARGILGLIFDTARGHD